MWHNSFYKTNNLHIQIHTHSINAQLHVSARGNRGVEKSTERGALCSVLITQYHLRYKIKKTEMGRACSTYGSSAVRGRRLTAFFKLFCLCWDFFSLCTFYPYFFVLIFLAFAFCPYCATQTTQTSMPPAGLEPAIPASKRPQTVALDRSASGVVTAWAMALPLKTKIKLNYS